MDQKLLFSGAVFMQIMKQLSVIDSFKGNWKALNTEENNSLKELRKIATIESIGSSTRIEGATLDDEEVNSLIQSIKITKLTSRAEQEVAGYYDALQVIIENYDEIDLSERYIHQLHHILLKHSSKDKTHRGKYKSLSNKVVANYPDGAQKIIFQTTDPVMTGKEMEELMIWVNERFVKEDIHPILVTCAFVYEFLSIHPYQDGNGRLSRLLTTFLLLKQGYGFVQYISFEHIIEKRKDDYYKALMDGQKNRYQENERIDGWVLFFLDCLVTLTKRLEAKYEVYSNLKPSLNLRQQKVLEFIKEQKTVQMASIEFAFAEESRNTLKKDLAYLVREKLILKTGERKGTCYHAKKEVNPY